MKTHELKCHPHFFAAIAEGRKTFEIRRDDRHYAIGDLLALREFDPSYGDTGKKLPPFEIVYIMMAEDFPAILPGFVIMGLRPYVAPVDDGLVEVPTAIDGVVNLKPIGEVVANLPLTQQLEQCNEYRKVAGLVLPRTCAKCGLGPCSYPKDNDDGQDKAD